MLDDFVVRATLAALGTALATGGLGCFVVWRRMAYFGDATAHAAVLGVALSIAFNVSLPLSVLIVAFAMALLITDLSDRGLAPDTALGVLSHGALALGLVIASQTSGARVDLEGYLFGDILLVSKEDIAIIWGGALCVVALLIWRWNPMLLATLSPDLARAEGIDPRRERLILALILAAVVAVSIKVVGALLITAMLIIPAAAARGWSPTPERMAILATALGMGAVSLGLAGSLSFDSPTGPTIICAAVAVFVASLALSQLRHRNGG